MKTLAAIPIVALASLSAISANAACWKKISEGLNSEIYVDDCSIAKDGNYKKAWVKWEYSTTQTTDDYPAKSYTKTVSLDYFNCTSRQSASIKGIYYSETGEAVKSESIELKRVRFEDPPPDTIGEAIMNYMCKAKK